MAFRWIHLSDFHFADTPDPYERNTVLEPLLTEITRRREEDGFQPDALFVTGDIAYSGKPAEYLAATRFFDDLLESTGLDKSRLFVVPGNHDLDKEKGDGLQRTLNNEKESVGYFAEGKPKYHFNKFQAFREWFDGYFQGIRACPNGNTCHPPETFNVDGLAVAVLPINTALFSLPDKQDHNSLWIGRRNLDAMVKVLGKENPDLTFALLHHPLDWLHDDECSQIETALQKRANFILRGHLHKNKVNLVINTHGDCLHLAAGACYQTRDYPNTALFCAADLHEGQLEVLPIHYVDDPESKWTLDTSLFAPPDYLGRFPMLKQSRAKEHGRVPDKPSDNKPTARIETVGTGQVLPIPGDDPDDPFSSLDPELLEMAHKLIVAILKESDAVTELLAQRFDLKAEPIEVCRDQVAQKALETPLPKLFDIALDGQQALLKRKPPDFDGANLLANFMQALLPSKQDKNQIGRIREKLYDGSNSLIELLASHKTMAEIIMAGADRRPTQFLLDVGDSSPVADGLIAHAKDNLEGGRDPNYEQFERDMFEILAQKFESRFGKQWLEFTGRRFPNSYSNLTGYQTDEGKKWLAGNVRTMVEHNSKQKARQIGQQGSGFTYYFLVNTPPGLGKDEKDKQDAALQRLHSLFPGIAFLRLAPFSEHIGDDLGIYLDLHFLLNPNEKPR